MPSSLGPAEILVILVVALIVLGPNKLPQAGRQLGRALSEVRRWSTDMKSEIKTAVDFEGRPTYPSSPTPSSTVVADPHPAAASASGGQAPSGDPGPSIGVTPDPEPAPLIAVATEPEPGSAVAVAPEFFVAAEPNVAVAVDTRSLEAATPPEAAAPVPAAKAAPSTEALADPPRGDPAHA